MRHLDTCKASPLKASSNKAQVYIIFGSRSRLEPGVIEFVTATTAAAGWGLAGKYSCAYSIRKSDAARVDILFGLSTRLFTMATFNFSFPEYFLALLLIGYLGSLKPSRLVQKSSRGFQQLKARCLNDIAPFIDFSPADNKFRCIFATTTKNMKCTKRVNLDHKIWANAIRNTIADVSPYDGIVEKMLHEYAENTLCHIHQDQCKTPDIDVMVQQWLLELRNLYDLHLFKPTDDGEETAGVPRLYPLTKISNSNNEDGDKSANLPAQQATVKHEDPGQQTPIKQKMNFNMPGGYPGLGLFDNIELAPMQDFTSSLSMLPSLPQSSTPPKYRQAFLESPTGITRIPFKRKFSTSAKSDSGATVAPGTFIPYSVSDERTLLSVMNRPLGPNDEKEGYVYIFTQSLNDSSHNGYVKIGVTIDVSQRMKGWKTRCGYIPHEEYRSLKIPNAMRAESLVHRELIKHRRILNNCPGCQGTHDEWIETDVPTARRIVDHWAEWMAMAKPYNDDGQLASHVVRDIFENNLSKVTLTGLKMLSLIEGNRTTEPAQSSPTVNFHQQCARESILQPDSGSLRRPGSETPGDDKKPTLLSDDDDSTDLASPSSRMSEQRALGAKHRSQDVSKPRKRPSFTRQESTGSSSTTMVKHKRVKVKIEAKDNSDDPFFSDVEMPNMQEPASSASSSLQQLVDATLPKNELQLASSAIDCHT